MNLKTEHFARTLDTLERAVLALKQEQLDSIAFDLYRNAAIKTFELSLETAGKLLRKALKYFVGNPKEIDRLVFNDVLRTAGKYNLMSIEAVERWIQYRISRNTTTHDYGEAFANETLKQLPDYLKDARELAVHLQDFFNANPAS